ncbi:MAG: aminotransferase class V-fold PLP-dependent enzyme [Cytophagales bacterium]|nr:aminotransferase class V-fold PLP-dependent enzyme [Cytophagales bacterium]
MTSTKAEKSALCGICPAGCWIHVSYDDDGKIEDVRADASSGNGVICKIGKHSRDIVYSDDRLQYPMKRKGAKGSYEFEQISWDEAYEIIVEKLEAIKDKHGPEATAIYTGRGSFELALCDVYQPKEVAISSASSVLFPFGSPNTLGVGALCYVSFAMIAPHVTMGEMYFNMFSDIENAEVIVVWGANPATDSPPTDFERIIKAHERGAKVIVIDPRRTALAKLEGAEWIPIRSGTDGALALGLCNVLIEEELYDAQFVENEMIGFEEFSQYVQHFTPVDVEEKTGVPAETVVSLARQIVSADGAAPVMYTGLEYTNSGVQNIRATFVLWAMAGQLDVPGGRCFSMKENQFPINKSGLIPNPDMKKALGQDRFPVYSAYRGESHAISLPESVLKSNPYKIRSLIIHGGSITTSWPEPDIWKETLNELDFLVCIDRYLTADAAYADIVLPATTMYEIESYMTYGSLFKIREKVIEPVGESRNDFFIMAELADKLGYGHLYPQNEEELLQHVLKGSGFSLDEVRRNGGMVQKKPVMLQYKKWEKGLLREDGKKGFDTPSGKFEIASSILEENGYDALPVYTEPTEGLSSDLHNNYPLIFNSGARVTTDFRSQHHSIESLVKERKEPTVTLNAQDAKDRGIENGELVQIETARGKVEMRAYVTDDIITGAIDANMGGGGPLGPEAWQKANVNALTDLQNYDPISGFPVYKSLLCEVKKVSTITNKLEIDSGEINRQIKSNGQKSGKEKRIYLDNNATTPLSDEVKKVLVEYLEKFGNPSSIYSEGKEAKIALDAARRNLANLINCTARRIIFTSGGSEANNNAIKGVAFKNRNTKNHIITTSIEHPSVLNTCKWLEENSFSVTYLQPTETGLIEPEALLDAITPKTCLVSIMLANNEVGTIQPIAQLAAIAKQHEVLFHTDAVQAIGKIPVDVQELNVDLLTMSGHKLHGPKGCGILYVKKGVVIDPLINGGSQEAKQRAGTENLVSIVGMGEAAQLAASNIEYSVRIAALRDKLEYEILNLFDGGKINGSTEHRLPNTLNVTLPEVRGESLVLAMDKRGVSLSSGSACRSGSPDPSHVLLALGLTEEEAHCSVRLSLGVENTEEEIKRTIVILNQIMVDMKDNIRFVSCR